MTIPLGPFDLFEPLGKGGMADVWRGVHRTQQLAVAVKVLTGERAREEAFVRALKNEIHAVARLQHPSIILVFDQGEIDDAAARASQGALVAGSPWFAMEIASHGALSPRRFPLPWTTSRRLLLSLLDALAYAHARGVIHRDLKPGNVLLCGPGDARPGLKLTDFGIAEPLISAVDVETTAQRGELSGTPRYMAPEQFHGRWRDFGPWTDLYALGCIAHQLATGKPPFSGDAIRLALSHCTEAPPPLQAQNYPDGYSAWVRRLLEKDPADRFACAADAAWALLQMSVPVEQALAADVAAGGWEDGLRSERGVAGFSRGDSSEASEKRRDVTVGPHGTRVAPGTELIRTRTLNLDLEFDEEAVTARSPPPTFGDLGELGLDRADATAVEVPLSSLHRSLLLRPPAELPFDVPKRTFGGENAPGLVVPVGKREGKADAADDADDGALWTELSSLRREETNPTQTSPLDVAALKALKDEPREPLAPAVAPPLPLSWRREGAQGSFHLLGAGLGLYGLRQAPLVDREGERDFLWSALSVVHAGAGPRVLVVRGPSGIGKTRLVEWIAERASELGGATVFRAQHTADGSPLDGLGAMIASHTRSRGLPRKTLVDRLERIVRAQGHDVAGTGRGTPDTPGMKISVKSRDEAQALAALLADDDDDELPAPRRPLPRVGVVTPGVLPRPVKAPAVQAPRPVDGVTVAGGAAAAGFEDSVEGGGDPSGEHEALSVRVEAARERHAVVRRFLTRASKQRPCFVFLDDAQWGADSIAFARHLLETASDPQSRAARVFVVLTITDESLAERPAELGLLERLLKDPRVDEVRLGSLEDDDHRRLVSELLGLDGALVDAVARRTAGNPLFAVQIVGDLVVRGVLAVGARGFFLKPGEQLRLPDDVHDVWRARIDKVLEGKPPAWRTALELGSTLGSAGDDGEWEALCTAAGIQLPSALIDALLRSRLAVLGSGGARFAHGMVRESVLRAAAEGGRLTSHHRRAAKMLDARYKDRRGTAERVARHWVLAGDLDVAMAPMLRAAREYAEAGGLAEAYAVVDERAALLDRMGAGPCDVRRLEGVALCANLKVDEGAYDEAIALADRVIEHAHNSLSGHKLARVLPAALKVRADVALRRAQWDDALERYEALESAARAVGDHAALVDAVAGLGDAHYETGRLVEADAIYELGRELCAQMGDQARMAAMLWNRAYVALWCGELPRARELLNKQQRIARKVGARLAIANGKNGLGDVARLLGEYAEAERRYHEAFELFSAIGSGKRRTVRINQALLALAQDDVEQADAIARQILPELERAQETLLTATAHAVLAGVFAFRERWRDFDRELELTLAATQGINDAELALTYEQLGRLCVAVEEDERAARVFALAIPIWRDLGRPDRADEAARQLGMLTTVPHSVRSL